MGALHTTIVVGGVSLKDLIFIFGPLIQPLGNSWNRRDFLQEILQQGQVVKNMQPKQNTLMQKLKKNPASLNY